MVWPDSSAYTLRNIYWSSRQTDLRPNCFVTPRNASAVSTVIKTLTSLNESFTVRAGGHTAFQGASNIGDGVTIDLIYLNSVIVSPDKTTVSVGAGNRWINVSQVLDPLGLAVVGGRVSDVGVSGLVLGGGISYFSGSRGWACDNVRNYEVVLSSGRVVNASSTDNPDLYWALRGGGGSNFGIVTRFDLAAFPQGDLWSNLLKFPGAQNQTLLDNFVELANDGLVKDPEAHTYFVLGPGRGLGVDKSVDKFGVLTSLFHSSPPPVNTTPPVFQPYQSVSGASSNVTMVANTSAMSLVFKEPYGSRKTWWGTTVATTSAPLFHDIVSLYEKWLSNHPAAGDTSFMPFLIFQPISQNIVEQMQKNGGNALGLKPDDGPLMIVHLSITWGDESLDSGIEQKTEEFIHDVEEMAKSRPGPTENSSLHRGFVYMNYAGKNQKVLQRYGADNYARLRQTAIKWDPEQHLQRLWKGYFQFQG